jgi:hypothetical protein
VKTNLGGKVTDTGLQEVVLHGPFHQLVGNGLAGDALVVVDGLVVVLIHCGQVRHLQEMLVRKSRKAQLLVLSCDQK